MKETTSTETETSDDSKETNGSTNDGSDTTDGSTIVDTSCDSITFSDPGQSNLSDTYTGVEQFFVLKDFTISPADCTSKIIYEISNVVGPNAGDYSSLSNGWLYPGNTNGNLGLTANLADFVSNALPEGVYTFTVTAKGPGSQSQTTDFTWTLDYLCNNRVCPTITPVIYNI